MNRLIAARRARQLGVETRRWWAEESANVADRPKQVVGGLDCVMAIRYEWHGDRRYYATVVDRYYAQVPLIFRLRSQAIIIWFVLVGPLLLIEDVRLEAKGIWLVFATAFAFAFSSFIRWGIVLKYRLRPSFDSETTFAMDANEVVVTGLGPGHFPWTVYRRAVRFSDGILLTRRGAIRWLPDGAITQGTAAEAVTLIHKNMPMRDLSMQSGV